MQQFTSFACIFFSIIIMIGIKAHATIQSHPQSAHAVNPSLCGSECTNDLSGFPFWDYMIREIGDDSGYAEGGSNIWLGEANGFGYVLSSNHNGSSDPSSSIRFVAGVHVGKYYKAAGVNLRPNSSHPNFVRFEPMQYASECTAANVPDTCCDAYRMGDGTCSGAVCGAGCITSALPGLPFMTVIPDSILSDGNLMITWGSGARGATDREWY